MNSDSGVSCEAQTYLTLSFQMQNKNALTAHINSTDADVVGQLHIMQHCGYVCACDPLC